MVAMLLAASNVVGLLVSPSAPVSRDAGHAVRRSTQLQMGVVRQRGRSNREPPCFVRVCLFRYVRLCVAGRPTNRRNRNGHCVLPGQYAGGGVGLSACGQAGHQVQRKVQGDRHEAVLTCTPYGARVPAICRACLGRGSLPPGPLTLYVCRTRASLGRTTRTVGPQA